VYAASTQSPGTKPKVVEVQVILLPATEKVEVQKMKAPVHDQYHHHNGSYENRVANSNRKRVLIEVRRQPPTAP
jgi:hypothetical protein